MKRVLIVRGMTLAQDTIGAWKSVDNYEVRFLRNSGDVLDRMVKYANEYNFIINLGHRNVTQDMVPVPVFNVEELLVNLNSPAAIRRSPLSVMLPPQPKEKNGVYENIWIKNKGFHDKGKEFHASIDAAKARRKLDRNGDLQVHVEGEEYRIITVGDKLVQASVNRNREYEWIGVKALPRVLLLAARYAAQQVDQKYSVVGWDFIKSGDDDVYLLEGNTSPGVNAFTAARILSAASNAISDFGHRKHFTRQEFNTTANPFEPARVGRPRFVTETIREEEGVTRRRGTTEQIERVRDTLINWAVRNGIDPTVVDGRIHPNTGNTNGT